MATVKRWAPHDIPSASSPRTRHVALVSGCHGSHTIANPQVSHNNKKDAYYRALSHSRSLSITPVLGSRRVCPFVAFAVVQFVCHQMLRQIRIPYLYLQDNRLRYYLQDGARRQATGYARAEHSLARPSRCPSDDDGFPSTSQRPGGWPASRRLPYYRSGTRRMLRLGLCTPHSA